MGCTLYDATVCRLCADDCDGSYLSIFVTNGCETFADTINRYLPINIQDDKIFPTKICLTCKNVVLCIGQYLEKVILGQKQINKLLKSLSPKEAIPCHMNFSKNHLYSSTHQLRNEATKRKRGRPRKAKPNSMEELVQNKVYESPKHNVVSNEYLSSVSSTPLLNSKRKRKPPERFAESVTEKELFSVLLDSSTCETSNLQSKVNPNLNMEDELCEIIPCKEKQSNYVSEINNERSETLNLPFEESSHHQSDIPNVNKSFLCKICGKGFKQWGRLLIHRRNHGIVKYQCISCQSTFSFLDSLKSHQHKTKHSGQGIIETGLPWKTSKFKIKCPCCSKSFLTKQGLDSHFKVIHRNFKSLCCNFCDKKFSYLTSLKIHLLTHQNQAEVFNCAKCSKNFKTKLGLHKHEDLYHSCDNLRPYPCPECGKVFKTRKNLKDHLGVHGPEPACSTLVDYKCDICKKHFQNKSSLVIHSRSHTGEKPFQCETCGKGFTQRGNMLNHKKLHGDTKSYKCSSCEKSFSSKSHLLLHGKRHIGDRSHKCPYCQKAFYYKEGLNIHIRRHLDIKPYICQICNKGFCDSWALTKHSRVHTGLKPYTCDVCGKTFSDCSNLNKHKKFHSAPSSPTSDLLKNLSDHSQFPNDENSIFFITQTNSIEEDFQDKRNSQQIIYVTYEEPQCQQKIHLVDSISFQENENVDENESNATNFSNDQLEANLTDYSIDSSNLTFHVCNSNNPLSLKLKPNNQDMLTLHSPSMTLSSQPSIDNQSSTSQNLMDDQPLNFQLQPQYDESIAVDVTTLHRSYDNI